MNLSPLPIQKFFDNNGRPMNGGLLFTYVAGTSTKIATYTDDTGSQQNTNPVVLDFRGEARVWLDPTLTYKFTLSPPEDSDPPTRAFWTVDQITSGISYSNIIALITREFIGLIFYPRTAAEIAAGVTPTFYYYVPGDVRRYGATLDGMTNDTGPVTNWLAVGGELEFPVAGTALISTACPMVSNSTIRMVEGAVIETATTDISLLTATSKTNIKISGGKLLQSSAGTAAYVGAISLDGCSNCDVRGVEFEGMQWAGVYLNNSSHCTVDGNYFHGWLGTVQDSSDVCVYRNSQFNVISNNSMYGGGYLAVLVQDPGSATLPYKNIVSGNHIGAHTAYGIISYNITAANVYTTIVDNYIEDISGSASTGAFGAGIYIKAAGGCVVANNTIRNCCASTSVAALTPAGIGVNGVNTVDSLIKPDIIGNSISDIASSNTNAINVAGINISSSTAGANVVGNIIRFAQGSAAGIAGKLGIWINAASNVNVEANDVDIYNGITGSICVFVFANGVNISDNSFVGNLLNGGSAAGIQFTTDAAFTHTNIVISGNRHKGGGVACINYDLALLKVVSFTGNVGIADTVRSLNVNTCTQFRAANNCLASSGANTVVSSGACTDSYFDKSNYSNGSGGTGIETIQNAATLLIVEQLGNAAPAANNRAIGDRVEQSVPVVGNPKGWRTTVAGAPGTSVSEGNL